MTNKKKKTLKKENQSELKFSKQKLKVVSSLNCENSFQKVSKKVDKVITLQNTIEILKQFDLDWRYGPCYGVKRLDRWNLANKNHLNPDPLIKQLILSNLNSIDYTEGFYFHFYFDFLFNFFNNYKLFQFRIWYSYRNRM
jgi:hypothetical protein